MNHRNLYLGGNIYGCGNIGDDAGLQGILSILRLAVPDSQITVATVNAQRLNYISQNINFVDSYDWNQIVESIRECDCFISGGGTMIGDELGLNFPLIHNARHIATAKYYGKKVIMLAIGANKLQNIEGEQIANTLIYHSDLITLRDRESFDVCVGLGARPGQVFVTADPAFILKAKETKRTKNLKAYINEKGKTIGINVINEAWTSISGYKNAIAKACDDLYLRYGFYPFLFSNEIRPDEKYDFQANRVTASMLKYNHTILKPEYYSPCEMIDILSSFDCVIAMRMHALIFAALAGTPFVAISRVDKVDNFMKMFKLPVSGSVYQSESKRIVRDIEMVLNQWPHLKRRVEKRIVRLRNDCMKNVDLIRDALTNPKFSRFSIRHSYLRYLPLSVLNCENRLKRNLMKIFSGKLGAADVFRRLMKRL